MRGLMKQTPVELTTPNGETLASNRYIKDPKMDTKIENNLAYKCVIFHLQLSLYNVMVIFHT